MKIVQCRIFYSTLVPTISQLSGRFQELLYQHLKTIQTQNMNEIDNVK